MSTFDIFTALLVFVSFLCMFWGPGGLLRRKESKPDEPLFSEKGQQLFNSKMAEEKRAKRDLEQRLEEAEAERQQLVRSQEEQIRLQNEQKEKQFIFNNKSDK